MSEIKPQFLDELSYAAKFDRQSIRDILTEGIVATDDLEITQLDTPAMGVKVASGVGYVQGDQAATQGHYRIYNDASKNLTIAASNPTHPRKDRIIAQVYDSIDIGGAEDKWALEVLTGTPAASPVVPDLPDDALDLAIVDVEANETTILDADITDQRNQITSKIIPTGLISLWSGSIASIPSGWQLCDGTNGTPNLRDKFVVGAGSSYAVGNTGGANTVTLTIPQMPIHAHSYGTLRGGLKTNGAIGASSNALSASTTGTYSLAMSGDVGNAGSGDSHENRPPYYALAYIMKL